MHKNSRNGIRALLAGLIFGCGVVMAVQPSTASIVPVPPRKPDFAAAEQKVSFQAVKEMFGPPRPQAAPDEVLDLLSFGEPPAPRKKPMPAGNVPLSSEDAAAYKKIFALQAAGDIRKADKEFAKLKDFRLRGHVLYQRYMHPTAYKSSYEELQNWLALYSDHPGADKIYKLAAKRGGTGNLRKPAPVTGYLKIREQAVYQGEKYKASVTRNDAGKKAVAALNRSVRAKAAKGSPSAALKELNESESAKLLDAVEKDILNSHIAAGYLYAGEIAKAKNLAVESVKRSGLHVPMAGWVAGLIAWREEDYQDAARYFEVTARSPYASGWTAAAGSYWAARSHMRSGNVRAVSTWLKRAAAHPRTFYGLIATRALGWDFNFNWDIPTFTKEHHRRLMSMPGGFRAAALISAGQPALAEMELVRLDPGNDKELRDAMLAYAGFARLPGLALRLGTAGTNDDGLLYDAALYPTGPWKPKAGYKIDPALIHAIMRQESRFDPEAESPSGARGLMQLMPKTASFVAGKKGGRLDDPETNLELGQRYLEDLLRQKNVDGDLFSLLIAYNAGPGNLSKWKKQLADVNDPLLFIESIPLSETRAYVEKVLSNYWIYRLRENLPTPTLDAVASGRPARYAMTENGEIFQLASSE